MSGLSMCLKHHVPLVTAQDLVVGEGWSWRFCGSGAAPAPWLLGSLGSLWWGHVWQVQLWTSCVSGLRLGYLRQPCCKFSCTEQSASCLMFFFSKLCLNSIILMDISLLSSSSLNLFMAGSYCFIVPSPLQREPSFCFSCKANVFLSHERSSCWLFLALFQFHLTFLGLSNLKLHVVPAETLLVIVYFPVTHWDLGQHLSFLHYCHEPLNHQSPSLSISLPTAELPCCRSYFFNPKVHDCTWLYYNYTSCQLF